jgi:hypothetical protein
VLVGGKAFGNQCVVYALLHSLHPKMKEADFFSQLPLSFAADVPVCARLGCFQHIIWRQQHRGIIYLVVPRKCFHRQFSWSCWGHAGCCRRCLLGWKHNGTLRRYRWQLIEHSHLSRRVLVCSSRVCHRVRVELDRRYCGRLLWISEQP